MSVNPPPANGANTMGSLVGLVNTAQEKWNASGANEAMGQFSTHIPDSTKQYFGSILKRDNLRSLTVFFGIGEERPFYLEKNPSLLVERLRHNISFFYLNYMIVTAILFCLTLITSPTRLIGMGLLAMAWMWVARASQSGSLVIGGAQIPQKTATIAMAIASVLFLFWLLSSVFWWALWSSAILVAIHAVTRDASMHKDMEDAVAMEGDLTEDAAFLNSAV